MLKKKYQFHYIKNCWELQLKASVDHLWIDFSILRRLAAKG